MLLSKRSTTHLKIEFNIIKQNSSEKREKLDNTT